MPDPIGEIPVVISGDWSKLQQDLLKAEVLAQQSAAKIADAFNSTQTGKTVGAFEDIRTSLGNIRMEAAKVAELPTAGLENFSNAVKNFVQNPIESAKSGIIGFIEAIGPLGVVAVAAGTAIGVLGKQVVDLVLAAGAAAEATSNLADRLNLSFDETKKLGEMAQIAGVELGGLNRASMNLANALEDTGESGKKTAAALKDIGIDVRTTLPSLVDVLEKLAEIPDANERISAANRILGKSAVQLEPLLRNYGDLAAAVESLGGKLSGEMVQALLKADDAADKLGIAWSHLKENIAATFAPAVTAGMEILTHLLSGAKTDTLENQISSLKTEIKELGEFAQDTSFSLSKMFAASTGMGGIGAESSGVQNAIKAQKEAALRLLEAQKEAFDRSKEYNQTLDRLERESSTRKLDGIEAAKKYAEALHKQNLEDIAKEKKAREDSAKAGEKLNEENIKSQKEFSDQVAKTQTNLDKAWYGYVLETRKAIGITDEAKHSFGELSEITVDLEDRLPAAILAAVDAAVKLKAAYETLGLDAEKSGTRMIAAFDTFAEAGKGDLEEVQIAWSKVSGQIEKIAQFDLPLAITEYQKYIGLLVQNGAAQGQILQAEERLLELVVESKSLRGEAATQEIVNLELIRLKQEAMVIQTRAIGDAYVALIRTFEDAFDSLTGGITAAIVEGKNLGDVFAKIGKQIYADIVGLIVDGAMKQLKAAIIENIDLFGKFGKAAADATKEAVKVPGIPTGGTPSPGGGTPSGGGAGAGGGLAGTVSAVSGVVSAVSDVIANFQFYAMNKSLDIIVKHTLETVNELRNWRRDAWLQEEHLFYKLDDMWNEIRNVVDILRLIGQHGLGGEGDGSLGELIAETINSRPASVEGSTEALLESFTGLDDGVSSVTPSVYKLDAAITKANESVNSFTADTTRALAPLSSLATGVNNVQESASKFAAFLDSEVSKRAADREQANVELARQQSLQFTDSLGASVKGEQFNIASTGGLYQAYAAATGAYMNSERTYADWIEWSKGIEALRDSHGDNKMALYNLRSGGVRSHGQDVDVEGMTSAFNSRTANASSTQYTATVQVIAVDPSGRQIANATIKGLEERGIRVR